jgi:ABC-type polar amino acid transport system ATPase subunit
MRAPGSLINLLCEMYLTMMVSTHGMRLVEELFPRTVVMDGG